MMLSLKKGFSKYVSKRKLKKAFQLTYRNASDDECGKCHCCNEIKVDDRKLIKRQKKWNGFQ